MPRASSRQTPRRSGLRAAVVLLALLGGVPAQARDRSDGERLPVPERAPWVAHELVRLHAAGAHAAFDQLSARLSPSRIHVAAVLLHPPGREPNEAERAVLARFVEKAPAESGVVAYAKHWQGAAAEVRRAERARWSLSARFVMKARRGQHAEALAVIEPELASLRAARFSQQASAILTEYVVLLQRIGRVEEAIAECRTMAKRLAAEGRAHEAVWADWRAVRAQRHGLDPRSIQALADPIAERAQRLQDWGTLTNIAHEVGAKALAHGDLVEARRRFAFALAVSEAAGLVPQAALARLMLARTARADSAFALARAFLDPILATKEDGWVAGYRIQARALRAGINLDDGRLGAALRDAEQLRVALPNIGSALERGSIHACLANVARIRGDDEGARIALESALAAYLSVPGTERLQVRALASLLRPEYAASSRTPERLARYRALVEKQAVGVRAGSILAGASLVEASLGHIARARALADRALVAARAHPDARTRFHAMQARADLHAADADWAKALALYSEAAGAAPAGSQAARFLRARVAAARAGLGNYREAMGELEGVVRAHADTRVDLLRDDALRLRNVEHRFAGQGLQLAAAWRDADPRTKDEATARLWFFREFGAGRLLAERIGTTRRAGTTGIPSLEVALSALERTHRRLVVAVSAQDVARAESLRKELQAQHGVVRSLATPVANRKPQVPEISLAELRERLAVDEAVLAFGVGAGRIQGLAVTRDADSARDLGDVREIAGLLRRWRALVSVPGGPDGKLAARLYDTLVRPIEGPLRNKRRWIVLPAGPVAGVPVDAWIRTEGRAARRVIESHELTYAHSNAVRNALRLRARGRDPARGLLALGDPIYPTPSAGPGRTDVDARLRGGLALPRLPGSGHEVEAIASLYPAAHRRTLLRAQATRDGFLGVVRGHQGVWEVVHLACHGIVDDAHPLLSGLVLAGGDVLSAERLENERVPADLVVLSACESGDGTRRPGEGVVGLTRSFFIAGATNVICTTWQVVDRSGARAMVELHAEMREKQASPAAALRAARLSLLRRAETRHPFHWAGYQLWGTGE